MSSSPAPRPSPDSCAEARDPTMVARTAAVAAFAAATPLERPAARRGRPKGSITGSGGTRGVRAAAKRIAGASAQAKSTAAVVLESLTGLRSAPEAAKSLGVSVARYYAVEAQAIAGLLSACEPAAPGPAPGASTERELARLRQDRRRMDQELARLRAVLRTTQRSLGIAPVAPPPATPRGATPAGGKRSRARRPVVRAMTVVRRLMAATPPGTDAVTAPVSTGPGSSGTSSGGPGGG